MTGVIVQRGVTSDLQSPLLFLRGFVDSLQVHDFAIELTGV